MTDSRRFRDTARIGRAALAGRLGGRGPTWSRPGAAAPAASALVVDLGAAHRRGPPAAAVAAAQISRGQAGARRAGAGRRADSAAGRRSLTPALFALCDALADGGAGEAATHIRDGASTAGSIEPASLLTASLAPRSGGDPHRRRRTAASRPISCGSSPSSPSARSRTRCSGSLFGAATTALAAALDAWNHGYCPACGSWPALAEVVGGHRVLRCSFCSAAWELNTYACIYCEESGEPFVTAAPDEERKDRRIEVCSALRRLPEDDRRRRSCRRFRCCRSPTSKPWTSTSRRWSTATRGRRCKEFSADGDELAATRPSLRDARPTRCSTSLCRLLPCASIVTIAGKSSTVRCHIASGVPNSSSDTPSTLLDRARVELRGAADRVQVDGAVLLQRRERLRAHAALADDRAHAVALDDLALIRLLADARRRSGGGDRATPSPSFTTTGPQWYSTEPRRSTGGSCFIRCECTASRPVNIAARDHARRRRPSARGPASSVSGALQRDLAAGAREARPDRASG